jgi:hypothetical protein
LDLLPKAHCALDEIALRHLVNNSLRNLRILADIGARKQMRIEGLQNGILCLPVE